MNRIAVTSSSVKAIGYDAEALALEVEFHSVGEPRVYRYAPVTAERHASMTAPDVSLGREIARLKADPSITCERVEEAA